VTDRGRVVVVAAGFGLWRDGKCLAAGKWTDVAQLRAHRSSATPPSVSLIIQLRDGSEVEILEEASGWATLVNALPSRLPGAPGPESWIAEVRESPTGEADRTLFEPRTFGR
jgi:hypothetical protein